MEGIKIIKRPILKNPCLICAWPGMGEVAFKAAKYLIDKLKAEEFAEVSPENFFYLTGSIVKDGILNAPELPYSKFYYWKNPATKSGGSANNFGGKAGKNDLIIFLSSAQPDLAKAESYANAIISLAKTLKVKQVVSFASMPQPVDHLHPAAVWFSATSKELKDEFKKYRFRILSDGEISGMNGLFLGLAKKAGLEGICLLGEIPLYTIQIENPKAAHAVLEALAEVLGLKIDLSGLLEQAKAMENEINRLLDYLKIDVGNIGPIGEEDIEKIKKSLSQFTKLPLSIKEKIERLFNETRQDNSKAAELKAELDKWNVYKEYEDRFLDLFKNKG